MEIPQIDLDQLEEELAAGKVLIDVRELDEYTAGHVAGAISMPMSAIAELVDQIPTGPLNIICQAGGRSQRVCEFLAPQGFDVSNVIGGTGAWQVSGRDVVTGTESI